MRKASLVVEMAIEVAGNPLYKVLPPWRFFPITGQADIVLGIHLACKYMPASAFVMSIAPFSAPDWLGLRPKFELRR